MFCFDFSDYYHQKFVVNNDYIILYYYCSTVKVHYRLGATILMNIMILDV